MALATQELKEIGAKDNRAFLRNNGIRKQLFGAKDPGFLNSHDYLMAFDRDANSMGPLATRVRMFTVDATDGSLKEKRHAPRQKDMFITLGQNDSVSVFYIRDGQFLDPQFLKQRAIETVDSNLRGVICGSIYPRQKRWETALHMITVHRAQRLDLGQLTPVDPRMLVDFTLAQRLLHALSAERLEIASQELRREEFKYV